MILPLRRSRLPSHTASGDTRTHTLVKENSLTRISSDVYNIGHLKTPHAESTRT